MKFLFNIVFAFASLSIAHAQSHFPYQFAKKQNLLRLESPGKFLSPMATINSTMYANMGNVMIGQSVTWSLPWTNMSTYPSSVGEVFTITKSGSSDFSITVDNCSNNTVALGASCDLQITFTPSAKTLSQGTVQVPWQITYNFPDGTSANDTGTHTIILKGSAYDRPAQCDGTVSGSIIGVEKQTLAEYVPLTGLDFGLYYSSIRAPEYVSTLVQVPSHPSFNNEGWTFGVHHYYSQAQSRLFLGTGEVQQKDPRWLTDGNVLIVSGDGQEVYIFSPDGKHLETRTGLMGVLKYSFGYDGNSRLTSITDAYSNLTIISRNGSGQMTSIIAPYGQTTTVAINGQGLVSSITNPNSEVYAMTYKVISQTPPTPDIYTSLLETFTKPGTQVSTFTYDGNGRLTKDLGNGGNFWQLIASGGGNLTKQSNLSRSTSYTTGYDSSGHYGRTQVESYGMSTASTEYSNGSYSTSNAIEGYGSSVTDDERFGTIFKRLSNASTTYAGVTNTTYFSQSISYSSGVTPDPFNYSSITKVSSNGGDITEVFTAATKEKLTTTDEGATRKVVYNNNERPVSIQVGSDIATTISYDTNGRISGTIQGSNNQKTYTYNTAGLLQSVTNALSEVTSYTYDLAGRMTSVTLPDTRVVQYSYDANGNLTSVTPPSKPAHAFVFNVFELLSQYQPPTLSGVSIVNTQYAYNMDKQLTQITRPTGATIGYSYSSTTGLLSSVALAGGTNSYTYYSNTDLVSTIDSADGIRSNYTYYGRNVDEEEQRKVSTNALVGKVNRTFDWKHRQNSIYVQGNSSSPALTTWTTYDNDGKPTQIGSMALTYSYPSGRLSTTTLNKISDSRTYDTYGNLSGYSAYYNPTGSPSVLLYSYTLTRDTLHRITSKTETIGGVTDVYDYTYDSVGRVSTVLKNSAAYSSYTYDSNSNRVSGVTNGASFTSTFDNQDRQLTYGAVTLSYNANGDRIQRVSPTSTIDYTWDALGNLKSVTAGGVTSSYAYDGKNRFVARSTSGTVGYRYIYEDDYRILGRTTDAGVMNQAYQYGTRVNTPDAFYNGSWYRVISDHLGSVRLVVRASDGVIGQRMDYNDLGRVTYDSAPGFQAYGFAGGIYLPTEVLVKFGARMYDPILGRWLTKDPILFQGGDTNLYGYVANDPVNFTDSTGLLTDQERARGAKFAGVGAAAGAAAGVCTSAGLATLPYTAIGAGLGYLYGAGPGISRDFSDFLSGNPSADNIFKNALEKK